MRKRTFLTASMGLSLLLAGCGREPQSEQCRQYVACVAELDATRGTTTDVARFEAAGGCWGSPEGATLCTDACTRGAAWLVRSYPEVASCAD